MAQIKDIEVIKGSQAEGRGAHHVVANVCSV